MLVDSTLTGPITQSAQEAAAIEAAGYDGLWLPETKHEPFMQLLSAAGATERVTVGTAIAIAFGRSPLTTANAAYDLALYSKGRFVLGLGSQVKAHVERRFSMPWSHPAARMREYVLALRAIWASWQTGEKLDFAGEFYTHTLMTPFFAPGPHDHGPPPVFLAGVGPRMTEVAGEVCDGFFFHPFTTARYLEEVTLPALARGRAKAGREDLSGFTVVGPPFICVGRDEAELAAAIEGTKRQLGFYGSTPAYRPVLDLHGWGDLQPELTRLSKEGRWADMGAAIDDEILHTFAVVGEPGAAGGLLRQRWGQVADRISLTANYRHDPAIWAPVIDAARR